MLHTLVLFAHLLVSGLIIGLVLLQRGKGADAGTGFGAGASGTVFGARGSATFFSRLTGVLAALFFMTSLALAYLASQQTGPRGLLEGSVLEEEEAPSELPALLPQPGAHEPGADELPELGEPLGGESPSTDEN